MNLDAGLGFRIISECIPRGHDFTPVQTADLTEHAAYKNRVTTFPHPSPPHTSTMAKEQNGKSNPDNLKYNSE